MHPAPSVIIFTVLSGLGFGMLAWLGLGFPDVTGRVAFGYFFVSYGLAVGGLLASTFHLGNPQRALLAFTQWRTSWLSREAWVSVITLSLMGIYAGAVIFFGTKLVIVGWIAAVLCLGTVFTTSMMYTQLKTVPRWNHPTTPLIFLLYSATGGALMVGLLSVAVLLLIVTGAVQWLVWRHSDRRFADSGTTIETATGLGAIGKVRQIEPPHTGSNYLLKEMVYIVARKHAKNLRIIALILAFVLPAIVALLPGPQALVIILAMVLHLAGVFVSRWLFFAEAEHVVGLYYDKR
ncbi:MAG: dimethyl sulfoxide reductase anchor subunit family protein [Paracoccaceae bacterium]